MKTQVDQVDIDKFWRSRFSNVVGGKNFDAPDTGYSFSAVLAEERKLEKINRTGDSCSALLKLSVADPTWKMPTEAMEAGMEYYRTAWDATRYKDLAGVLKTPGTIMAANTHEMIANCLQKKFQPALASSEELTAEWVQYLPGSIKRALGEYLPTLFLNESIALLFPTPSYQVIASPMNRRDAALVEVPLIFDGKWQFDLNEFEHEAIKHLYHELIAYINVPHNPTGTGFRSNDWQRLIEWAIEQSVILVIDEAYIDLAYSSDIVSALKTPGWEKCAIVLQSVSKGWNATGLRFGWAIANPTVIKALRKAMDVKDSGGFGPSIVSGVWCLLHPEVADETKDKYQVLHQTLAQGLTSAGFKANMPDAGLCQLTPAPKAVSFIRDGCPGPSGLVTIPFQNAADCAKWFRRELRISVMHAQAADGQWLRWAVTLQPVPECGLADESSIINEAVRRLQSVQFKF